MENKPETLVILSPGFPENQADTTCMPPMQLFVKGLKDVCPGLNVIVIAFQYPNFRGEYDWNGIKVIALGGQIGAGCTACKPGGKPGLSCAD